MVQTERKINLEECDKARSVAGEDIEICSVREHHGWERLLNSIEVTCNLDVWKIDTDILHVD